MAIKSLAELIHKVELVTLKDGTQISIEIIKKEDTNLVALFLHGDIFKRYLGHDIGKVKDLCIVNPLNNNKTESAVKIFTVKLTEIRQLQLDIRKMFLEADFDLNKPEKHYAIYNTLMNAIDEDVLNKGKFLSKLAA